MTPTPEQVAAAKAWTRSSPSSPISAEHYAALEAYVEANKGTPGLWQWSDAPAFILLAALEAAEQQLKDALHVGGYEYFTAQLRNANQQAHNAIYVAQQLEKKLEAAEADSARLFESLDWAMRQLDDDDATEIENGGDFLHRDSAGYKQCRAVLDAARKAQP